MTYRVWRAIRSMPPSDTRPDFYCIAESAEAAEQRIRRDRYFEQGETLDVTLFEEFEWPVTNCDHPRRCLLFWQYGAETPNRLRKLVRCYQCYLCGARVHDDTPDGHMVPCDHKEHRPPPVPNKVWS